jgi:hypothetical protein
MQRGIVVTTALALLGGCAADSGDGGILVLKNVRADDMCATTGGATEATVTHGTLDLLELSDYLFIAQMQSRITALMGQESQRTIVTEAAKVDITFPGSTLFSDAELADLKSGGFTHFKSQFAASILPNGGLQDGGFVLIPASLVEKVAAKAGPFSPFSSFRIEAVATFVVQGNMSGEHVESQSYSYPVTLGNNIAIGVPTPGTCPLPKEFGMPRKGYACNPFQDGVIDCCRMATGALLCPASISTL